MAADRGNGATAAASADSAVAQAPQPAGAASAAAPAGGTDPLDLKARLDRFGEILARGLDLAEAGMSLGLTIVSTVGAAAQQKIAEKMMNPGEEAPRPAPMPPPMTAASAVAPGAPAEAPRHAAAEPVGGYGITNRLPLVPGGPASISFSINNDSADAPRLVALQVGGFRGEAHGHVLPPNALRVVPDTAAIAPMDFEKFVLAGTIPAGTPFDTYRGSILVAAEASLSIPVLLVVGAPGDVHR